MASIVGIKEYYATTSTGVDLYWTSYDPDDGSTHPAVLVYHAGGFKAGNAGPQTVAQDFGDAGFLGLAVEYRLAPDHLPMNSANGHPVPGQDDQSDDGHYPEQTEDVALAIRTARSDPRCNGLVYVIGGSAGASHTAYMAATGTAGDDQPDLAVVLSGVYNLADMAHLTNPCTPTETCFVEAVLNYIDGPTSGDITGHNYSPWLTDLATASPVTYFSSSMPPIYALVSSNDTGGVDTFQFPDLISSLEDAGITETTADVPVSGRYKQAIVPVNPEPADGTHAFAYWNKSLGPGLPTVKDSVIAWMMAGPPSSDEDLGLPYTATLSAIGESDRNYTIPRAAPPAKSTLLMTGLTDDTDYTLRVWTNNEVGRSATPAVATFTSDPTAFGSLKPEPRGLYTIFSVPVDQPIDLSNLTLHPWWQYDYIAGCRFRSGWYRIEEFEGTLNWSEIDDGLTLCSQYNKKMGLSLAAGIYQPDWMEASGAQQWVETGPDAGTMSVPWSSIFLAKWRTFIAAAGERYDAHPKLSYVVLGGLGQIIEMTMGGTTDELITLGGYAADAGFSSLKEAYLYAAGAIMQAYSDAFPTTRLVLSLAKVYPETFEGSATQQEVVAMALARSNSAQFGFMNAGLNGRSNVGYLSNYLINQNYHTHSAGFQYGHQSSNPLCDPTQDPSSYDAELGFRNAGNAGIALGAKYLEPYEPDTNNTDADYITDMESFVSDMAAN